MPSACGDDPGDPVRTATRAECAAILFVCSVGSVILAALVFAGCWFLRGVQ